MTLEGRSAGTSNPGRSNLAGQVPGEGKQNLGMKRLARRSIMMPHRES